MIAMTFKNSSRFFYFLGGIILVVIFFMPFQFQTNDDTRMMLLVSGIFSGTPENYAVYLHPILSFLIASLYRLDSQILWYPILWFVFFYLAYVGWIKVVVKVIKSVWTQLLLVIAFLTFSFHNLIYLQFTVVAGILAFSGFLLILLKHYHNIQLKKKEVIFGIFLCVLSFLVRKESFFLMTMGFGFLSLFILGWKSVLPILYKKKWLILIVGLLWLSTPIYENFGGYQEYAEFNRARSRVLDHPVLPYINTPKEWGLDGYFFRNWLFGDNPSLSADKLNQWSQELNTLYFNKAHLLHSINYFFSVVSVSRFMVLWFLLSLLILFLTVNISKKVWMFISSWLFLFFLINFFYLAHARVHTLFYLMILVPAILLYREKASKYFFAINTLSCVFIMASIFHGANFIKSVKSKKSELSALNQMTALVPKKKVVFMDWVGLAALHFDPKKLESPGLKLFYFGWTRLHPAEAVLLNNMGYNSLKEINSFYFLHVKEDDQLLLPNYLMHLNGNYGNKSIASNEYFELLYFYKEENEL